MVLSEAHKARLYFNSEQHVYFSGGQVPVSLKDGFSLHLKLTLTRNPISESKRPEFQEMDDRNYQLGSKCLSV